MNFKWWPQGQVSDRQEIEWQRKSSRQNQQFVKCIGERTLGISEELKGCH